MMGTKWKEFALFCRLEKFYVERRSAGNNQAELHSQVEPSSCAPIGR
jgi:hypothetical protein